LLHFLSLSLLHFRTPPSLQSPFTRRTSGHCLGTFIAEHLCPPSVKCSVSHYSPPLSIF
jgi:hypothetical protein